MIERSLLLDLYAAFHKSGQVVDLACAGTGIEPEDFAFVSIVGGREPVTPTAISREFGLSLSTVLFRATRNVELGFVERVTNPQDGRSFLLRLTPEGRRAWQRAGKNLRKAVDSLDKRLAAAGGRDPAGARASCRPRSTRSWPKARSPPADSLASVRLFARLFRLIWGAEVDAAAPAAARRLVRRHRRASPPAGRSSASGRSRSSARARQQLGVAYLIAAVAGFAAGYLGGHLSDYVGRRPMILLGWALLAATFLAYTFVGHHVLLGLGLGLARRGRRLDRRRRRPGDGRRPRPARAPRGRLCVRSGREQPRRRLRPADRRRAADRAALVRLLRSASPCSALVAIAIGYRFLPRTGAYAPTEPPSAARSAVIRRDHAFLLFLVSAGLAYLVYVAYETVIPIAAVNSYGISPVGLGLHRDHQPALVTLFQLRRHALDVRLVSRPQARGGDAADGRSLLLLLVTAPPRCSCWCCSSSSSARCSGCRPRRRSSPGSLPRTSAARTWAPSGAWARSASRSARSPASAARRVRRQRGLVLLRRGLARRRRDRPRGRPWRFEAAGNARRGRVLAAAVSSRDNRLGAIPEPGGNVRFRVWAPNARSVDVRIGDESHALEGEANGVFAGVLRASPGDDYLLRPRRRPGAARSVLALPASRATRARRESSSCLRRVRRGLSLEELVVYELHVGTFSRGGDVRRSRALPARAARAGRHGDRADAGRDLPRASGAGATTASTRTRRIPPTAGRTGSRGSSRPRTARGWA